MSGRGFLREVPLLCRAMLLAENGRECCKTSGPGVRHCVASIRHRVRDDIIAALLLYPPCPTWARYLIARSTRRILWRLFRSYLSSSEVPSTEECTKLKIAAVTLEQLLEPQNNEGRTPEMSSVTPLASPRRGDILEGELGPYIPASPVKDFAAGEIVGEARPSVVANFVQAGSSLKNHSSCASKVRQRGGRNRQGYGGSPVWKRGIYRRVDGPVSRLRSCSGAD